jgi:cyanophycin synthetase
MDVPGLLQLLKFQELRAGYYRELWREAARNVGADCADWKFGYMRISRDGMTTVVKLSSVMIDDHLTLDIMGNKALTYELLAEKGCSVPTFRLFSMRDISAAEAFLEAHGGPVVVKPARGTGGGRGVTTGITNVAALRKAARMAARSGRDLIIEKQISGNSYRLLYLDGAFVDAVRRDAPILVGDGRHTIRELIRIENRRRLNGSPVSALSPLKLDRDCVNRLRALKLRPGSRLADGQIVDIKHAVNENCARRNHAVAAQVHPDTIAMGGAIARDLGVRFAGFDVLCQDISAPLTPENGCVNEINTTPGIHHHYLVSNPAEAVPVAERVLSHLFRTRQGIMILGPNQAKALDRAA